MGIIDRSNKAFSLRDAALGINMNAMEQAVNSILRSGPPEDWIRTENLVVPVPALTVGIGVISEPPVSSSISLTVPVPSLTVTTTVS